MTTLNALVATAAQWRAFADHLTTVDPAAAVEILDVTAAGIRYRLTLDAVWTPAPVAETSAPETPAAPATPAAAGGPLLADDPGGLSLGGLQDALEECESGWPVRYVGADLEGQAPTAIASWRGDYAQLAIDHEAAREHPVTAAEVLEWVTDLLGGTPYHGYKGGEYTAWASTEVHVANWGEAGTLHLTGVSTGGDTVWLHVTDTAADEDEG